MNKKTVEDIVSRGDDLFQGRGSLLSLWQDIANNFFVQRADFTSERWLGEEFADHLYSGYPLQVHRELSNAFSSMLRPQGVQWFYMTVEGNERLGNAERQWLERAQKVQWSRMYDRRAMFVKAMKEGDQDFSAFGQYVLSYEIDWRKPALLYRTWHLRDCAWEDGYDGSVRSMHRNWDPKVYELVDQYGEGRLSDQLRKKCRSTADAKTKASIRVAVIPSEWWKDGPQTHPFVRLVIEKETKHIIEEVPQWDLGHIVPRWQTVSGSQYAYSPATVTGLPDARLLQAMTLTLLEAGEMAVRPPVVAIKDAIREDMQWFPGGVTVADAEYDQRLGDVLQPISQDLRGLSFGMEMTQDTRSMLAAAFYLNKITLPPAENKEMTAYETQQRIMEYIRAAAPLFEPAEYECNAVLCENTFDMLMRAGAFGPMKDIPEGLRGRDIRFVFESPLHEAIERKKGSKFLETREMIMAAMELDPPAKAMLNVREALRDALHSVGTPAKWLNSEDVVEQHAQAFVQQQEADREMMMQAQMAQTGKTVAEAEAVG